jgi:hypothetical protein
MLPDALATHRFNLGVSDRALTFSARLGDDGEIVDWNVGPSILRNIKTLHYRNVNQILSWDRVYGAQGDSLGTVSPWVSNALKLLRSNNNTSSSQIPPNDPSGTMTTQDIANLNKLQSLVYPHMQLRVKRGAILSDQPSFSVSVSPYPTPLSKPIQFEKETISSYPTPNQSSSITLDPSQLSHVEPASLLVSECMIIAGRVAAKFCTEFHVPAIYRCQSLSPLPDSLQTLRDSSIDAVSGVLPYESFTQLINYMQPGRVQFEPAAHEAMGIPGPAVHEAGTRLSGLVGYVKVTSPLRRYKDLMMHWAIKSTLLRSAGRSGVTLPFRLEDLERIVKRLHGIERMSNRLGKKSETFWALEWIRRREVLWRMGGRAVDVDSLRDSSFDSSDTNASSKSLKGVVGAMTLPGVGIGPRGPLVWGEDYRRGILYGLKSPRWEALLGDRKGPRPTYKVLLTRVSESKNLNGGGTRRQVVGILRDFGGILAQVYLVDMNRFTALSAGDVIECQVDTVDPSQGILVVTERKSVS